jgi:hypothetical protein
MSHIVVLFSQLVAKWVNRYSSDAHITPELFYLGSKWGRIAVKQVLEESIGNGEIDLPEAKQIAWSIFRTNAMHLYKLE